MSARRSTPAAAAAGLALVGAMALVTQPSTATVQSAGAPAAGAGDVPPAKCSKANRFRGRTDQNLPICFKVTRGGLVKGLEFNYRAECDIGASSGWARTFSTDVVDSSGRFAIEDSSLSFRGKVEGRRAEGTLRYETSTTRDCATGRVEWRARRR
jgi:hypothetical protein